MSNRTIIRTKYIPRSPLERSQTFSLVGMVKNVSEHGIQVSRRDSKGRFWIDTDFFLERNEQPLADKFLNQEVKLSVTFNCYTTKGDELFVKPHLIDINLIDSMEAYGHEFQNQHFTVNVKVEKVIKTQFPGLYVLMGNRVNSEGFEFERYIFRHYTKDMIEPELGVYEVTFNLQQSSKIITSSGEIFFDEEEYTVTVDGETSTKRTSVYLPALDTVQLIPVVS